MIAFGLILPDGTEIGLNGPALTPPYSGTRYIPAAGDGETVDETLAVRLVGTPAQIESEVRRISLALNTPMPSAAEMVVYGEDGLPWTAAIVSGRVEMSGAGWADRQRGSQSLLLHLSRVDAWCGAVRDVPLSNINGQRVTSGLLIHNHLDSAHANFVDVAAQDIPGDLPALLRIELANTLESTHVGDVFISQAVDPAGGALATLLEGEAAATPLTTSTPADATCSNGQYRRITWAASGETILLTWTFSQTLLAYLRGRVLQPMLRFAANPADSDLWLYWQVTPASGGSSVFWQSPALRLEAGLALVELPPCTLPPFDLGTQPPYALYLSLVASRATAAACTLDVDFVQLLPADGFLRLGVVYAVPPAWTVVVDGAAGRTVSYGSSGAVAAYNPAGVYPQMQPGCWQRFSFLHRLAANSPVDFRLLVKLRITPRRRVL